ncbi:MAG: Adenylate cyclase, partial [Deltaproteobacteria bacterium]|nr:Adenylate cyclase [Deltaproteobacteria bacterium]
MGPDMARLIFSTAQGKQLVELAPVTGIGRHPNSVVQLLDRIVSKEHCVVERRAAGFVLRDMGSMNGTFINGVRVSGEQLLCHGDSIKMGSTEIRFDDGMTPANFPLPEMSEGAIHHPPVDGSSPGAAPAWAQRSVAAPPPTPVPAPAVNVDSSARSIGQQVLAQSKEFLPFDEAARDTPALRMDYERLRITWELIREIGLERDVNKLLEKILVALFRFVNADRGVILLKEADGSLKPRAVRRRDGTQVAVKVSSTILAHVLREKAGVLTHDASSDFAVSEGKSMFLNRISSAIVVPLLHENEVVGALWLDSETLASFKPKDLELLTAVGNQVAMLISNTLLARKIESEIVTRERFSRLLSPNVAEQVISGKLDIKKGGIQVPDCTVFNSDLRGFTRMSEGTTAEKMVDL